MTNCRKPSSSRPPRRRAATRRRSPLDLVGTPTRSGAVCTIAADQPGVNHYGITNTCQWVIDAFNAAQFPVDDTGQVDSHTYSVAGWGRSWVVADAGANALLRVRNDGSISTLAVLPQQQATITAEQAAALGLPDCVVGVTYAFEPVPP